MQQETVSVKSVIPDPHQPRKYFDAIVMKSLKQSIEKHGIMNPLIVEKLKDGRYRLVDGERRFRSAQELGLKEVPAIVEEEMDETDRLVRQFTLQEMHAPWTPIERALALIKIAEALNIPLAAAANMLGVTKGESRYIVAFASLADPKAYVESEVPIAFVADLVSLKNGVRKIFVESLKEEFTLSAEKKLERRLIKSIKDGSFQRKSDLTRLKDAFVKEPKLIDKYLTNQDITPTALFLEAGGQGARALRNTVFNAHYIRNHGKRFLENPDVKISVEQLEILTSAQRTLQQVIDLA